MNRFRILEQLFDYGLRITPTEEGDYRIVCNEFCGVGHHLMVGKVTVLGSASAAADTQTDLSAGAGR